MNENESEDVKPKIAVGCSGCLTLLLFAGLVVSLILPVATDGRASWDEVMPASIGSGSCCVLSVLLLGGAIFWLVQSGKE